MKTHLTFSLAARSSTRLIVLLVCCILGCSSTLNPIKLKAVAVTDARANIPSNAERLYGIAKLDTAGLEATNPAKSWWEEYLLSPLAWFGISSKEASAAFMVVRLSLIEPGITGNSETLLATVPVVTVAHDEVAGRFKTVVIPPGPVTPYFRFRAGSAFSIEYSTTYTRKPISTYFGGSTALLTSAASMGTPAAQLLSPVTKTTVQQVAKQFDASLGQALALEIDNQNAQSFAVTSAGQTGVGFDIEKSEHLSAGKVTVKLDLVPSVITDRVSPSLVPLYPNDPNDILRAKPEGNNKSSIQEFFWIDQNRDWFKKDFWDVRELLKEGDRPRDFSAACQRIRMYLNGQLALNSYDTAAAFWALLKTHPWFEDSVTLRTSGCVDSSSQELLDYLKLGLKPIGTLASPPLINSSNTNLRTFGRALKRSDAEELQELLAPNVKLTDGTTKWLKLSGGDDSDNTIGSQGDATSAISLTLPRDKAARQLLGMPVDSFSCFDVPQVGEYLSTRGMLVRLSGASTSNLALEVGFNDNSEIDAVTLSSPTEHILEKIRRNTKCSWL
jgi:hypothetical protein